MQTVQGLITVVGRIFIVAIFFLSAIGKKIPGFQAIADYMTSEGVPASRLMLAGAIVFLILGSLSVVLGFRARLGATLLLIFLILASYFFHDFWTMTGEAQEAQLIQFMKNLSMTGTMLLIMANGSGKWSLDDRLKSPQNRS